MVNPPVSAGALRYTLPRKEDARERDMMSEPAEYSRTRILMIDDDTKLCRLVKDYLEPLGYEEIGRAHV